MARFRAYVTDSEEEEEDVSMEVPPAKTAEPQAEDSSMDEDELRVAPRRRAHAIQGSSEEDEDDEDDDEDDDEEEEEEETGSASEAEEEGGQQRRRGAQPVQTRHGDPTIIPWAREIGVDPQKMHVMQTSLFRMPEEEKALKALNEPHPRRRLILTSNLSRKHSRDSEGDGLRADSRQVRGCSLVYARRCSGGQRLANVVRS